MDSQEIQRITSQNNACITAPAGHGKTEMIADIVKYSTVMILVLTHTNAGVDAIRKRLIKRSIPSTKYRVRTIAGFCRRWCNSYPVTAKFDLEISSISNSKKYYKQLYDGTKNIFLNNAWAGRILKNSYGAVIVDEYQDCIISQHEIFVILNKYLPVWVLGDPLQGIFGWAGQLVEWDNIPFTKINVTTKPWRWKDSNPLLGEYLDDIRDQVVPALKKEFPITVTLSEEPNCLIRISPEKFDCYKMLPKLKDYESVLYITDYEGNQLNFCKSMGGIFQEDEKQDCNTLYDYSRIIDNASGTKKIHEVIKFVSICASHVGEELNGYIHHLEVGNTDFSKIRKNPEVAEIIRSIDNDSTTIIPLLEWCRDNKHLNFYRKELFEEMIRTLKHASMNNISLYDASQQIRTDSKLQKRYSSYKYLSSRTVLSKGLEFDCVIIDAQKIKSIKDFYVALTRAKKMIYVICDDNEITFYK